MQASLEALMYGKAQIKVDGLVSVGGKIWIEITNKKLKMRNSELFCLARVHLT